MSNSVSYTHEPNPKPAGLGLLYFPLILSAVSAALNFWSVIKELQSYGSFPLGLVFLLERSPLYGAFVMLELVTGVIFLLVFGAIFVPGIRKIVVFPLALAELGLLVGYVLLSVNISKLYVPVIFPIQSLIQGAPGETLFYLLTDLPFYLNLISIVFAGICFARSRSKPTSD
jgi:hypothetical protein